MESYGRTTLVLDPSARTLGLFIRWTVAFLCCGASLLAQEVKPDHINEDMIGESVDEYIENNPYCAFFSDPVLSRVQPRETERIVLCLLPDDRGVYKEEPNTTYKGIPLKTVEATFLSEEGLVSIKFEVRRTDYHRLKTLLLEEFRLPTDLSPTPDEILTWDNGISRIDLQEGEASEEVSYVFLQQDKYLGGLIILTLEQDGIDIESVKSIDGDYLLLQGPEKAQVKVKVENY
jgi:hypothetical protein